MCKLSEFRISARMMPGPRGSLMVGVSIADAANLVDAIAHHPTLVIRSHVFGIPSMKSVGLDGISIPGCGSYRSRKCKESHHGNVLSVLRRRNRGSYLSGMAWGLLDREG